MFEIGRRIYFDKATGEIIQDTGERISFAEQQTVERDYEVYTALQERDPETVGMIELEYGQHAEDFAMLTGNGGGVRVNTETLSLEFAFPDGTTEPAFQEPLTAQIATLKAENSALQSKVEQLEAGSADQTLLILDLYEMMSV